ncbi:cell division protein FtsQ/DivIB [Sphingomonas sp. G-3-2-10]|jgi:cell division protein FtsQ|uniref:cell division protein FtsQ/DivIB n=1 Tax=Sphingomonas sp. G-3-2-10 TaxID=2728838 RepID=UPI00146DA5FE|nr:cell division protein FtsQ/DivIB [Sphingomonas sp. G-3-2-10]NML05547.1 FtsQ-type POTRA domain-containing protein [Sphingomonas sp. G-3-2-10]
MTKRTVRRSPARAPAKKRQQVRKKKGPGLLDQAMSALPVSHETLQKIATWGIVGVTGAVALGVASFFGVPGMVGVAASEVVGEMGFRVEQVDPYGLKHMDKMTVYQAALDQKSRAMPLVDLELVRERLLQYPWIEDARVSRRLPNTLVVNVVEREAAAVWQNRGVLMLIDPNGVALESVSRDAMPDLPLLVGEGANKQEHARRRLMEAAPALKPLVKASSWVGNRRWDLTFDTGERLMLPEGEKEAADALKRFAEDDGTQRLLGRGFVRFDMRVGGTIYAQRRPAPAKPALDAAAPVAENVQGEE